jgi:hypothetical protein
MKPQRAPGFHGGVEDAVTVIQCAVAGAAATGVITAGGCAGFAGTADGCDTL